MLLAGRAYKSEERVMEAGFARFPQREENYKRYLQILSGGGQEVLDCLPIKMGYEVASHCNFRCTMCAMSEIGAHRPADMKFEMYNALWTSNTA